MQFNAMEFFREVIFTRDFNHEDAPMVVGGSEGNAGDFHVDFFSLSNGVKNDPAPFEFDAEELADFKAMTDGEPAAQTPTQGVEEEKDNTKPKEQND